MLERPFDTPRVAAERIKTDLDKLERLERIVVGKINTHQEILNNLPDEVKESYEKLLTSLQHKHDALYGLKQDFDASDNPSSDFLILIPDFRSVLKKMDEFIDNTLWDKHETTLLEDRVHDIFLHIDHQAGSTEEVEILESDKDLDEALEENYFDPASYLQDRADFESGGTLSAQTEPESVFDPATYLEDVASLTSSEDIEDTVTEHDPSTVEGLDAIHRDTEDYVIDSVVYGNQDFPTNPDLSEFEPLQRLTELTAELQTKVESGGVVDDDDAERLQASTDAATAAAKEFFPDTVPQEHLPNDVTTAASNAKPAETNWLVNSGGDASGDLSAVERNPVASDRLEPDPVDGNIFHDVFDSENLGSEPDQVNDLGGSVKESDQTSSPESGVNPISSPAHAWFQQNRIDAGSDERITDGPSAAEEEAESEPPLQLDEQYRVDDGYSWFGNEDRINPKEPVISEGAYSENEAAALAAFAEASLEPESSPTVPPIAGAVIEPAPTPVSEPKRSLSEAYEMIDKIESKGYGLFERWVGDVGSPVTQLAEVPFERFAAMARMSKVNFERLVANEYRDVPPKYEAMKQWGNKKYFASIEKFAKTLPAGERTTKQVIERYFTEMEDPLHPDGTWSQKVADSKMGASMSRM